MNLRFFLFFLLFLLSLAFLAEAKEIEVLYFFNPPYKLPENVEKGIREVKSFWKDKVDWIEYNYSNLTERKMFEIYEIFSLPVSLVKCFNQTFRVERSMNFSSELNQTIWNCYVLSLEKKKKFPLEVVSFLIFVLIFLILFKIREDLSYH